MGAAPICEDTPVEVLILHDGSAAIRNALYNAMVNAGYHAVIGPAYHQWNGTNPGINENIVVIVLEGKEWGRAFLSGGDSALVQHLNQGGSVIRGEWAAYDIADKWSNQTGFHAKMPVWSPAKGYHFGKTWTLSNQIGALGEGVPSSFTVPTNCGCSVVQAKAGAVVLASVSSCGPGLSYIDIGNNGGRSFHINDDLGGENAGTQSPSIIQLYVNVVRFVLP